jgi:hypothetical protein
MTSEEANDALVPLVGIYSYHTASYRAARLRSVYRYTARWIERQESDRCGGGNLRLTHPVTGRTVYSVIALGSAPHARRVARAVAYLVRIGWLLEVRASGAWEARRVIRGRDGDFYTRVP